MDYILEYKKNLKNARFYFECAINGMDDFWSKRFQMQMSTHDESFDEYEIILKGLNFYKYFLTEEEYEVAISTLNDRHIERRVK
jgi:hypothetical protein